MRVIYFIVIMAFSFTLTAQPPAPDFTVTDTDGVEHTLYEDYLDQGTTVVLKIFFVACPPCNAIAPSVQELYEDWGEGQFDVEFMELTNKTFDDDTDVSNYKNQHGLTFPGISADGGSIEVVDTLTSGAWGPFFGTPSFYVIAPDGEVFSGLNFAAVNPAIEASGATGEGGNMELTTSFNLSISNAATSNAVSNVTTLITDAENTMNATAINLGDYDTVESILEAFPGIDNPAILFYKNDDHLNGVSTLDISLITKHVLGIQPFQENYKIQAADINRNGTVSGVDLSALTKVVLGIEPFPADSWLFDPPLVELVTDPGNNVSFSVQAIKVGNVN